MATLLLKDLTRESTELVEDKNVIITLTENQRIEMRLKGTRSEPLNIGILELYEMLAGVSGKSSKTANGDKKISLNDLRSANLISTLDYETKVKFESIIVKMLEINS